MRFVRWRDSAAAGVAAVLLMTLAACSGGSSTGSTGAGVTPTPPIVNVNNVQPVVMDYGPILNGQSLASMILFTRLLPFVFRGPSTCQSIDHVLVDTGSSGLRIPASVHRR